MPSEILNVIYPSVLIPHQYLLPTSIIIFFPQLQGVSPIYWVSYLELAIHYACTTLESSQIKLSHSMWKIYHIASCQLICYIKINSSDNSIVFLLFKWPSYIVPLLLPHKLVDVIDSYGVIHYVWYTLPRRFLKLFHLLLFNLLPVQVRCPSRHFSPR